MPGFGLAISFAKSAAAWLVGSRVGNIVVAFAVAWIASGIRHDHAWETKLAAQAAAMREAHAHEVAREAEAARDIAEAATSRAADDAQIVASMRGTIADLKSKEPIHVTISSPPDPVRCIDRDFVERVRKLDAIGGSGSGYRAASASQGSARLRKGGSSSAAAQCRALKAFALENRAVAIEANRGRIRDGKFYDDVLRDFGAK